MTSLPHEIQRLFEDQAAAMRSKSIDRLMACYSPDIVYFDVVPPLQFVGAAELRARFSRWFDGYDGPIGMEIRELNISASGDTAFAHWFSRSTGTLKDGRRVGFWVRVSSCCRRSGEGWLITHEHVSLPVDLGSGNAVRDLVP